MDSLKAFIKCHRTERIGAERRILRINVALGQSCVKELQQSERKSHRQCNQKQHRAASFHSFELGFSMSS